MNYESIKVRCECTHQTPYIMMIILDIKVVACMNGCPHDIDKSKTTQIRLPHYFLIHGSS